MNRALSTLEAKYLYLYAIRASQKGGWIQVKQSKRKDPRFPDFQDRFRILVEQEKSQIDFANKVCISRQTVGFYYNGERVPDVEGI